MSEALTLLDAAARAEFHQRRPAPYTLRMDRLWTPWRYAYISGQQNGMPKRGVAEALAAWPGETGCVFCNMLAATAYAVEHGMATEQADKATWILERGDHCFLVLNAFPYNSGHLMIVPYEHQSSLAALSPAAAAEMMTLARRAEEALRAAYLPDGLNMGLNLGASAGAGVADHLHMHALPRWAADSNFMSVIAETRVIPEMLADTYVRVRAALRNNESKPLL